MKNKKLLFISITILLIIIITGISLLTNNTQAKENSGIINKKATTEIIKFNKKKINIYFFWGDGCPHCEEEYEFWDSILKDYKDKINHIYGLEVWNHKKNAKDMKEFAKFKGDEIKGVPYTIIGEKTFIGFDISKKKVMKKAIDDAYKSGNSYDIYKEMTKNND
ncbi:MAG: thioredoxin family protein [Bacilli bacterium]|nr:thioredoxin family protein [Bacilli bacterium]